MTTTLAESGVSAANPEHVKRLNLLLIGAPGSRKTVTAHSMPRTRTIDFDDGMQSVEWAILAKVLDKDLSDIVYETILRDKIEERKVGGKVVESVVEQLNRAMDQVDEWVEDEDIPEKDWDRPYPQKWDTLIIDSATFMTDAAVQLALIENKRLGISKSLEEQEKKRTHLAPMRLQDWGAAGTLFLKAVTQWKAIGKNLIVVAHEYEKTSDEGMVLAYQPNVIGRLRSALPAAFDEVWYTRARGAGKTYRINFVTGGDVLREAKTRIGCLNNEEEANFSAIKEKIAKFYGVKPEQLWTPYHGTEGRKRAEDEMEKEAITV